MGEKFTKDDTPDYAVVLEGFYIITDPHGHSNRLWEKKGTRKKGSNGDVYFANQQVAIVPVSVAWTSIHWYPIGYPIVQIPQVLTLQQEMKF